MLTSGIYVLCCLRRPLGSRASFAALLQRCARISTSLTGSACGCRNRRRSSLELRRCCPIGLQLNRHEDCVQRCRHRVAEARQAVAAELVQVQARVQVEALDDERLAVPHALRFGQAGRLS